MNVTVLKIIFTSRIGKNIVAAAHGLETIDTLTRFKRIRACIKRFEVRGGRSFLFDSGYLIGKFVRDKETVQACLLIADVNVLFRYVMKGYVIAKKEIKVINIFKKYR
ncbi:hypothetical protein WKU33_09375 [Oceanobacillus sp. HCA-5259]|uniref:hypothetical protein n=1 Tax=Oceanobacillus sp. HCA-5259 TaxID=3134661 RepID=UPI0030BF96BA